MKEKKVIYSDTKSKEEIWDIAKIIITYIATVVLWLYVVYIYKGFGSKWILPSVSVMWCMGAFTSFMIKEKRESTAKETKYTILGFCLLILLYRFVLQQIAPISSTQLGASLNISIPSSSGIAATGLLQQLLVWISIMTPIGFLVLCANKFRTYSSRKSKNEETLNLKGIKSDRRKK